MRRGGSTRTARLGFRRRGRYLGPMPPSPRSRPLADFIEPCLPRLADKPPAGPDWLHEIKHDGFRIMARRDGDRVRLLSRKGHDFASRFPLAAAAVAALSARSCIIDGEAIACDEKGLAVFDLIRRQQHGRAVALCAFDLLELDGEDLRRMPIETRKLTLKSLLRGKHAGIMFNCRWRNRLPPGLCAWLRGHCFKAPRVAVPLRPCGLLAEGQESGCACSHARG